MHTVGEALPRLIHSEAHPIEQPFRRRSGLLRRDARRTLAD